MDNDDEDVDEVRMKPRPMGSGADAWEISRN